MANPTRIVTLAAEVPEILSEMGCLDRVVGISTFTTRPAEVLDLPKVSGFAGINLKKVLALEPDLVIAYSHVQAKPIKELLEAGVPVLALAHTDLAGLSRSIRLLGNTLGEAGAAEQLVSRLEEEWRAARTRAAERLRKAELRGTVTPGTAPRTTTRRPRIYFEEWYDPLITGIAWVSELIELAGGEDLFPEMRGIVPAFDRRVEAEEVRRRAPDIIVASWCGLPARLDEIAGRPGWEGIPAVQHGRLLEIPSDEILQPGPVLLRGLARLEAAVAAWIESGGESPYQ